ncbi:MULTISPECIES: GDSL-type esterase/lipase family protein [unclassified Pseudomonas]|uniref:SGNH/GDSL hydrolase family protein n=1 Tax=unclassified Pseudomonas TaxID=196821 RepID=UPI001472E70C|nr:MULTISPECIES: GDSL-type esterase/lipase family protein [unclassified Pseudomonas]NMX92989.1 hypothetical protein [Pseudomonas sp. WS 5086]NMY44823.1 hypothetical protein [Pseudomonas sp. WS 5027]
MKKVFVLTDSLGLPRVKPARIDDEQCWTYRLADQHAASYRFRVVSVPGMDTNQLVSLVDDYYQAIDADVVIVQVGIVDCYPRAIKKTELSLLLRMPGVVNRLIHRWVKRNYATLIVSRGIRYVQPEQFKANLQRLSDQFPRAKVLVVPIAPPSAAYITKNPRIEAAVAQYNAILASSFPNGFLAGCYPALAEDIFLSDNHHLNAMGNEQVFQAVSAVLARG